MPNAAKLDEDGFLVDGGDEPVAAPKKSDSGVKSPDDPEGMEESPEDWAEVTALVQEDEDALVEIVRKKAAVVAKVEPVVPATEPAQPIAPTPEPSPTVAAIPPTPAVTPEPAPTPTAPEPPPVAQPTDAEWQKMRADYEAQLEPMYKLSDEDSGKMVLNPNEVLPKLAARLHANISQQVIQQVTQALMAQLPPVIEQTISRKNTSEKAETDFFTRWPELKAHKQTVMQIGRLYRAQNPAATMEDFIQNVGVSSWMTAKLPVGTLAQRMQGTAVQPTPPAPPQPAPGYNPATPASRAAPAPAPATNANPFGDLATEMKEDFF
jgi:hypothetical protein